MRCDKAVKQLSFFLDDVMIPEEARDVSRHLEECAGCHRELDRLARLRRALSSMDKVDTPEYLHHLIQLRLAREEQSSWQMRLREALEYRWSIIRTTESLWYFTRILGTAATFVLFVAITAAIRPIYMAQLPHETVADRHALQQQLPMSVLKNLGLNPVEAQRRPISSSEATINPLYSLNFSQSASRATNDDTLSVAVLVNRSGSAIIQDVLEHPADSELLSGFAEMIRTARFRPASQNGKPVDSHVVLTFSKISVYD
jgi:hypothetical protein